MRYCDLQRDFTVCVSISVTVCHYIPVLPCDCITAVSCLLLYGTVWYCMLLYGTVWYCLLLYGSVYGNIFRSLELYVVLHCVALQALAAPV